METCFGQIKKVGGNSESSFHPNVSLNMMSIDTPFQTLKKNVRQVQVTHKIGCPSTLWKILPVIAIKECALLTPTWTAELTPQRTRWIAFCNWTNVSLALVWDRFGSQTDGTSRLQREWPCLSCVVNRMCAASELSVWEKWIIKKTKELHVKQLEKQQRKVSKHQR